MDQPGSIEAQEQKKDHNPPQGGEAPSSGAAVQPHAQPHVNGVISNGQSDTLPNGVPPANGDAPTTNGEHNHVSKALMDIQAPPELDQSWRDGDQNKSLGTLLDRLAQQCYMDLNETLTKMSEIQVEPQPAQANGASPQPTQDTSEASLQKKRLILDFAHDQRDRFTKTLVLSDWSRNEKEMARLIDIKVWQDKQRFAHMNARHAIGQLKVDTVGAKMPSPNIDGAIELLATGKASWVPDFGYIPPKRLTAKQLLRTLRNMNVLLSTRLNLHDELPPHMEEFTIADGRATFTVPDEFEVDLSVADEEPTSPFYFIDIRLLFTPSSNALDERLRGFLEGKVNEALSSKGLQGCYDFLHNFVLTHKINLLRGQAQDLIGDKWFDCIKLENLRRSLTVQYWSTIPGPKNWFEIGIGSGKEKKESRRTSTPKISVRWFRKGIEAPCDASEFDWRDLDLEKMLMIVISKHTSTTLRSVRDRIQATGQNSPVLKLDLETSESESIDSVLSMNLPCLQSPLKVTIEPITGQFSITPRTSATASLERRLNNDASVEPSKFLASGLCAVVQEKVAKQAELLGWLPVTNRSRQDLSPIFGFDAHQHSLFACDQGWSADWALGVTFGLFGEKWWIVQMEQKLDLTNTSRKFVKSARPLAVAGPNGQVPALSQQLLLQIEKLAVAEVSFGILSQELKNARIPYFTEKLELTPNDPSGKFSKPISASMYIRFSALMRDNRPKSWKPWAIDYVRLTHQGLESSEKDGDNPALVRHNLRLTLKGSRMEHLQKHFTRSHDKDLAFKSKDGLALRLHVPFGQPFAKNIQDRLRGIERLDHHVGLLGKQSFTCSTVNQSRLAFVYCTKPELSAQLLFTKDKTRLKLQPENNPHLRIRSFLEQGLNSNAEAAFGMFVDLLPMTRPVMDVFDEIENLHLKQNTMSIHVHGAARFRIQYKAPLPACAFDLRARTKVQGDRRENTWFLTIDKSKTDMQSLPTECTKALAEVFKENGEGWTGIGNSIVAEVSGIQSALQKVDATLRRFESAEKGATKAATQPLGQGSAIPCGKDKDVIMLD